MNELSLFSGYGGFSLGLRLAGLQTRTVAYVEWEKYPQEILKARIKDGYLDDAPIFADISSFRGEQFRGMVDIITAGFPCQPHSVAGLQRGANDDRNKWPDTLRVIREVGPRIVVLENVPGLASASKKRGTPAYGGTVVGELASLGYSVHWQTLGAGDVGAPHRRKRWWCIAVANGSSSEPTTHTRNYGEECGVSEEERKEHSASIPERGSRPVVNPSSGRYREPDEEVRTGGNSSEYTDRDVANSEGERYRGGSSTERGDGERFVQSEEQGRSEMGSETEGRRGELADSDSQRGRSRNTKWEDAEDARQPSTTEEYNRGIPAWPPGPNQSDEWRRILTERPDLAPALTKEAEPQFRGVVDGRSNRVDELKALGNGIVPAVLAEFLHRVLGP